MVNALRIPICIYNRRERTKTDLGSGNGLRRLTAGEDGLLRELLTPEELEYPRLMTLEDQLILMQLWNRNTPEEWLILGPVLPDSAGGEYRVRAEKRNRGLKKLGFSVGACSMKTLISGALLFHWQLTGEERDQAWFWKQNEACYVNMEEVRKRISEDLFHQQERQGIHNPYEQENRELESIRNGDLEALERSIAETYEGEIGILAKEPLRHQKNVAIGNITLASRAAVEGGLSVERSFSMADSFICQVEEFKSVPEVEVFNRSAQRAYAEAVNEERQTSGSVRKNPLIAGVKDYIFSHLHGSVQITDIARALGVNPDYLSHLFKEQEGITIKRYILQEKIDRSKNLLQYSDYSIQEIAFYLNFSSQSHFTRVFQETVGKTPGEYRKRFRNRKSWGSASADAGNKRKENC